MRVIGSVQIGKGEYQSIWASISWIEGNLDAVNTKKALVVRNPEGANLTIVSRNAKYAEVESAIRQLRSIGLKDAQLHQLLNYRGDGDGLCRHVKMLVSSLR